MKERCQDGWFRGINRAQKSGVFPGNYVTPLRNVNEQSNGSAAASASAAGFAAHSKRSMAANSGTPLTAPALSKCGNVNPPELPPRSSGSSSSSSSVWSKPIGQHVEAFFGRKICAEIFFLKFLKNFYLAFSELENNRLKMAPVGFLQNLKIIIFL